MVEKAKEFFTATVGWSFNQFPMGDATYWVAMADDKPVGGLFPMQGAMLEEMPPHWMSYLEVDNVDDAARQIATGGRELAQQPRVEPWGQKSCRIISPGGSLLGFAETSWARTISKQLETAKEDS